MQRSLVNDANGILLFLGIKVALRIWMSESIKFFTNLETPKSFVQKCHQS
jgi:hypothetical protein